jgi:hypothetical protein
VTRFRRHRRLALLPAIAWLVAQFVMSGIMSRPAEAAGLAASLAQPAPPGLSTVVICTPTGLELLVLDGGSDDPTRGMGGPDCKWCQAFGAAPELTPPADGAPARLDSRTLKFRILAAARLARLGVTTGFQSRAPPF